MRRISRYLGFNLLVGANSSGKTSVLEAIYTLTAMVGRFAVTQIGRVIRHEQEAFVLREAITGRRAREQRWQQRQTGRQQVRIDG